MDLAGSQKQTDPKQTQPSYAIPLDSNLSLVLLPSKMICPVEFQWANQRTEGEVIKLNCRIVGTLFKSKPKVSNWVTCKTSTESTPPGSNSFSTIQGQEPPCTIQTKKQVAGLNRLKQIQSSFEMNKESGI